MVKRNLCLSVENDLIEEAKSKELNISLICEEALIQALLKTKDPNNKDELYKQLDGLKLQKSKIDSSIITIENKARDIEITEKVSKEVQLKEREEKEKKKYILMEERLNTMKGFKEMIELMDKNPKLAHDPKFMEASVISLTKQNPNNTLYVSTDLSPYLYHRYPYKSDKKEYKPEFRSAYAILEEEKVWNKLHEEEEKEKVAQKEKEEEDIDDLE